MGIAVSRAGMAYVADWWGHRIEEFSTRGTFVRAWGQFGKRGPFGFYGHRSVAVGQFSAPTLGLPIGVAPGPAREFYVTDAQNNDVVVLQPINASSHPERTGHPTRVPRP